MKAFCDNPPGFILLCSCFLTMSLNRTKLKYGTMKLKAYEKIIWMIELGAIYVLGRKVSILLHPESIL